MATNNALNLKTTGLVYCDTGSAYNAKALPLTPTNAGTGATTFTAYSVLCTGTTASGTFQNVASLGTSGQILLSNGTSSLPSFQTVPTVATGFTFRVTTQASSPAASTTYYMCHGDNLNITVSTRATAKLLFPVAATITACYGNFTVGGTLASAQNVSIYLRKNDTTDTTISTTLQLTSANSTFNATGLSIAMSAGDYVTFKMVCPAWGTLPTTVRCTYAIVTA